MHRLLRRTWWIALAGSALLLSGCGFQLAGQQSLPPELRLVYVDLEDPYSVEAPPLLAALTRRITRSGGTVVASLPQAHSVLRLSNLNVSTEVAAIGPDGRALEYRLVTSVNYSLAVRGKPVTPVETQTVSSDYSFNAQQILAKEEEQQRLEGYTQDELAQLILLRVSAALRQSATTRSVAPST
ncbi:MAG TPA: LPS assembly lipoprotein LptE [Nevskiaceae bacterium]